VVSESAAVVSANAAVVSGGRFLAHANAQSQGTGGAPLARKPTVTWGDQKCVHFKQKRFNKRSLGMAFCLVGLCFQQHSGFERHKIYNSRARRPE
jgi:hypothetical protein